jgi:hypothetical protein
MRTLAIDLRSYSRYWAEANQAIYYQLDYESPKEASMIPKDKDSAFQHMTVLYIKYIQ